MIDRTGSTRDPELLSLDTMAIAQTIADSSPTPLFVLDRNGLIRFTNQALDELLGWNRYEVLQTPWSELFLPSPGAPSFARCLQDALRGMLQSYKVLHNGPDGKIVSLTFSLSAVGDGATSALVVQIAAIQPSNLLADTTDALFAIVCNISTRADDVGRLLACGGTAPTDGSIPQEGEHCYQFWARRQIRCEACPYRPDAEGPWPRIRVVHEGVDHNLMRIVSHFPPKGDTAKLLVYDFPTSLVSDILRSKVKRLAEDSHLTAREQEVFDLVLLGRSLAEIATALGIVTRTAKFHQANVFRKIGAETKLDIFRLIF